MWVSDVEVRLASNYHDAVEIVTTATSNKLLSDDFVVTRLEEFPDLEKVYGIRIQSDHIDFVDISPKAIQCSNDHNILIQRIFLPISANVSKLSTVSTVAYNPNSTQFPPEQQQCRFIVLAYTSVEHTLCILHIILKFHSGAENKTFLPSFFLTSFASHLYALCNIDQKQKQHEKCNIPLFNEIQLIKPNEKKQLVVFLCDYFSITAYRFMLSDTQVSTIEKELSSLKNQSTLIKYAPQQLDSVESYSLSIKSDEIPKYLYAMKFIKNIFSTTSTKASPIEWCHLKFCRCLLSSEYQYLISYSISYSSNDNHIDEFICISSPNFFISFPAFKLSPKVVKSHENIIHLKDTSSCDSFDEETENEDETAAMYSINNNNCTSSSSSKILVSYNREGEEDNKKKNRTFNTEKYHEDDAEVDNCSFQQTLVLHRIASSALIACSPDGKFLCLYRTEFNLNFGIMDSCQNRGEFSLFLVIHTLEQHPTTPRERVKEHGELQLQETSRFRIPGIPSQTHPLSMQLSNTELWIQYPDTPGFPSLIRVPITTDITSNIMTDILIDSTSEATSSASLYNPVTTLRINECSEPFNNTLLNEASSSIIMNDNTIKTYHTTHTHIRFKQWRQECCSDISFRPLHDMLWHCSPYYPTPINPTSMAPFQMTQALRLQDVYRMENITSLVLSAGNSKILRHLIKRITSHIKTWHHSLNESAPNEELLNKNFDTCILNCIISWLIDSNKFCETALRKACSLLLERLKDLGILVSSADFFGRCMMMPPQWQYNLRSTLNDGFLSHLISTITTSCLLSNVIDIETLLMLTLSCLASYIELEDTTKYYDESNILPSSSLDKNLYQERRHEEEDSVQVVESIHNISLAASILAECCFEIEKSWNSLSILNEEDMDNMHYHYNNHHSMNNNNTLWLSSVYQSKECVSSTVYRQQQKQTSSTTETLLNSTSSSEDKIDEIVMDVAASSTSFITGGMRPILVGKNSITTFLPLTQLPEIWVATSQLELSRLGYLNPKMSENLFEQRLTCLLELHYESKEWMAFVTSQLIRSSEYTMLLNDPIHIKKSNTTNSLSNGYITFTSKLQNFLFDVSKTLERHILKSSTLINYDPIQNDYKDDYLSTLFPLTLSHNRLKFRQYLLQRLLFYNNMSKSNNEEEKQHDDEVVDIPLFQIESNYLKEIAADLLSRFGTKTSSVLPAAITQFKYILQSTISIPTSKTWDTLFDIHWATNLVKGHDSRLFYHQWNLNNEDHNNKISRQEDIKLTPKRKQKMEQGVVDSLSNVQGRTGKSSENVEQLTTFLSHLYFEKLLFQMEQACTLGFDLMFFLIWIRRNLNNTFKRFETVASLAKRGGLWWDMRLGSNPEASSFSGLTLGNSGQLREADISSLIRCEPVIRQKTNLLTVVREFLKTQSEYVTPLLPILSVFIHTNKNTFNVLPTSVLLTPYSLLVNPFESNNLMKSTISTTDTKVQNLKKSLDFYNSLSSLLPTSGLLFYYKAELFFKMYFYQSSLSLDSSTFLHHFKQAIIAASQIPEFVLPFSDIKNIQVVTTSELLFDALDDFIDNETSLYRKNILRRLKGESVFYSYVARQCNKSSLFELEETFLLASANALRNLDTLCSSPKNCSNQYVPRLLIAEIWKYCIQRNCQRHCYANACQLLCDQDHCNFLTFPDMKMLMIYLLGALIKSLEACDITVMDAIESIKGLNDNKKLFGVAVACLAQITFLLQPQNIKSRIIVKIFQNIMVYNLNQPEQAAIHSFLLAARIQSYFPKDSSLDLELLTTSKYKKTFDDIPNTLTPHSSDISYLLNESGDIFPDTLIKGFVTLRSVLKNFTTQQPSSTTKKMPFFIFPTTLRLLEHLDIKSLESDPITSDYVELLNIQRDLFLNCLTFMDNQPNITLSQHLIIPTSFFGIPLLNHGKLNEKTYHLNNNDIVYSPRDQRYSNMSHISCSVCDIEKIKFQETATLVKGELLSCWRLLGGSNRLESILTASLKGIAIALGASGMLDKAVWCCKAWNISPESSLQAFLINMISHFSTNDNDLRLTPSTKRAKSLPRQPSCGYIDDRCINKIGLLPKDVNYDLATCFNTNKEGNMLKHSIYTIFPFHYDGRSQQELWTEFITMVDVLSRDTKFNPLPIFKTLLIELSSINSHTKLGFYSNLVNWITRHPIHSKISILPFLNLITTLPFKSKASTSLIPSFDTIAHEFLIYWANNTKAPTSSPLPLLPIGQLTQINKWFIKNTSTESQKLYHNCIAELLIVQ